MQSRIPHTDSRQEDANSKGKGRKANRLVRPTEEEVARFAYLAWETAGRPSACSAQYWLEAEMQLIVSRIHDVVLKTKAMRPARNRRILS